LYDAARALAARVTAPDLRARLDSLAPPRTARARAFGAPAAPAGPPTLGGVRDALVTAAMAMQGADVAPTADQEAAVRRGRAQLAAITARWSALRAAAPR
jgi:hypothetical protein